MTTLIIEKVNICQFCDNIAVIIILFLVDHQSNLYLNSSSKLHRGFPGGTVVKNLPGNAGETGSSPGLGRSHMLQSN